MSVLIKAMEMPQSCIECKLLNWKPSKKHYRCPLTNEKIDDDTELSWGYMSKDCPLVEVPEQKHGTWIRTVEELGETWMCSECLEEFIPTDSMEEFIGYVHFCPNCGARMDEEI